jgi:hypothetical protein
MSERHKANHLSDLLNAESSPEESGNSPCKNLPARFPKRRCGANFAKLTVHGAVHAPQDNSNLRHLEQHENIKICSFAYGRVKRWFGCELDLLKSVFH